MSVVFLWSALAALAEGTDHASPLVARNDPHPVTVADSITMKKLGNLLYYRGGSSRGVVAQFSPDGKNFVVVLRKGNVDQNTNQYSLLLWRTADALLGGKPNVLLTMSSASNRPGINKVTWLPDNETIVFTGETKGTLQQLYALNYRTHVLKRITHHHTNLLSASISSDKERLAFVAEEPTTNIFDRKAERNGVYVSTQWITDIITTRRGGGAIAGGVNELFYQNHGVTRRMRTEPDQISSLFPDAHISPNGKYIVIAVRVAHVPALWQQYADAVVHYESMEQRSSGQVSDLMRYQVIDTTTGASHVLLDSPVLPYGSEVAWSEDSSTVVLTDVYLPLENTTVNERETRRSTVYAVELNVSSGRITPVASGDLMLSGWDTRSNCLTFSVGREKWARLNAEPGPRVSFRKKGNTWEKVDGRALEGERPDILLDENIDTPPRLVAFDSVTKRRTLLMDLNPQFSNIEFAKVEEISWKGTDGHDTKGGLYYPLNYVPGQRYPLVIQTHGWSKERFWIDGPWTTAFAAQALAARDAVVLQVDDMALDLNQWDTATEVETAVAAYEGAIDDLDHKGLIDRNRVGIIGFSRTCMFVLFALTHSKYHFTAVSLTDGLDAGYFQYVAFLNASPMTAKSFEGINGGVPFGEGLKSWVQRSPGFNLNRIEVPVRIVSVRPEFCLVDWEWFAALTRLRRAVEMVVLQDGDHILQKPWERIVSQQGNVDWFDFWLNGHEDPDAGKVEQYAHWRELRKLQQQNEKNSPAPSPN